MHIFYHANDQNLQSADSFVEISVVHKILNIFMYIYFALKTTNF